jgi:NADPH-dependent ferric siderophore reductase
VTTTPDAPRRKRHARTATVVEVSNLTPHMIRVVLGGPGLDGFEVGEFTDHYVKLLFPPPGAAYRHPFDVDDVQENHPREQWPVTRTYTVRRWDAARGELTLDFVYHGDEGLAGPWAANAKPGDSISFLGPGGGYTPNPEAPWHLLVGDESALPAIATALERLSTRATAVVVIEVEDESEQQELRTDADVTVSWVHRASDARAPGAALIETVQAISFPSGEPHAFVHGDAGVIREIRRYLRSELGLRPDAMSVSGYWRRGRTDEAWRAEKGEWKREVELDDEQLATRAG